MILIGDAGSTKTDWAILRQGKPVETICLEGLNPYQQSFAAVQQQLKPLIAYAEGQAVQIFYYGSGVIGKSQEQFHQLFKNSFPNINKLELNSDILAAARALCNNTAGIACILGTGSNSCLYNGKALVENIGGFGFILGDEGSGAVLGKQLLTDFLYNRLPADLHQDLTTQHHLSRDMIYENVYRKSFANRFLAGFAPILLKHRSTEYVQQLLAKSFQQFINNKIRCYQNHQIHPIHFVGSIAYFFADELRKALSDADLQLGNIEQKPIQGLIRYHRQSN